MELETHNPFLRRSYSKLARHWKELANRLEREETAASRLGKRMPAARENSGSSRMTLIGGNPPARATLCRTLAVLFKSA
jgi:hypothetical protein